LLAVLKKRKEKKRKEGKKERKKKRKIVSQNFCSFLASP